MKQAGQLIQEDFFNNTGGLNLSESPFLVENNQSISGSNYNYTQNGGITKRLAALKINASPNAALLTKGFGLYDPINGSKSVIRAADTKIQLVDTNTPTFTNLSFDDSTASTDILDSDSQAPIIFSQFNNGSSNILWFAGNGTIPYGVYSESKVTRNGVEPPDGSITATVSASGGNFAATGEYYYAVLFRKNGTQALSNLALDKAATIANVTDKVTINLAGITNNDTTLYDEIHIYRSALNGVEGFTTGDLIAELDSSTTSFVDLGTSILESQVVPRAGSLVLDNSVLPDAEYVGLTVFKRRLVTAEGNTIHISDINKSESWPTVNQIVVPTGGNITGLAVISFTSPQALNIDELLVIFKERELWVITGDSYEDYILKFIDATGVVNQPLVVTANGFLSWIDYRGIYLWDGTSKPIYCSRLIEPLFARDGNLNKLLYNRGIGQFFRKENLIIWYLSNKLTGDQKYALKMDLRYTMPQITQLATGRSLKAVIIPDEYTIPTYAALSYVPTSGNEELMILGDDSGFIYFANQDTSESGADYSFTYSTKYLDLGNPGQAKRYHKVIAWVQELGDWNLTLDYWTNFEVKESHKASQALPITDAPQRALAYYDIAYWDIAKWDDAASKLKPLVYNLNSYSHNNNEGDVIRLQFRNDSKNQPITISGFSIIYSLKGVEK